MRSKYKCKIEVFEVKNRKTKKYFRGITLNMHPRTLLQIIRECLFEEKGIDINEIYKSRNKFKHKK